MHLQAIVDDVEAFVGGVLLGHGAVHCVFRSFLSAQLCSVAHHKSRRFEVCGHLGELKLEVLVVRDWCSKLLPLLDVICGVGETGRSSS